MAPLELEVSSPPPIIHQSLEIQAKSALVMELSSGMVLYEKKSTEKRPIASLTKLMTALLVLESGDIWDTASVSLRASNTAGSQMHLLSGEKLLVADLLTGLLVPSANDAAIALAEHTGGTVEKFVEMMNRRALYLGLINTQYSNPHGLDQPGNYSTAFDVALLTKKLLESSFVRKVVQTKKITVDDVTGKFTHELKTTNELLFSPFPIYGVKTGTTDLAGQCFVGLTRVKGKEYIIVILGSTERFQDTKALVWALQNS